MILLLLIILIIIIIIIIITFINEDYVTHELINIKDRTPYHKVCLLLTTFNTKEREEMYDAVITWWVENSNLDIFIVNSSGNDFKKKYGERVKTFTYNQNNFVSKGKNITVYEITSIQKIVDYYPEMLTNYTMIIKLTGKYRLPMLEKYIENVPKEIDILFQNNRGDIFLKYIGIVQNTELYGLKTDKFNEIIYFLSNFSDDIICERRMSKLKLQNYNTVRLPVIDIPEQFRVKRSFGDILNYL